MATKTELDARFASYSKIFGHPDWLIKYKVGEQVYPICWEIDPSNQCQLNCDYCCWATLRTERGDVMSGKRLTRLIHEISELDGKSIIWSGGGDPLTNPKTADAIELAHRMEIDNGMFTNGLGMNKRNRDMLKGKLNWVRFHVGGDNFETYSRAHQVPKEFFGIAVANIEKFNREKNGTSVGIGVVANQDNFDGIQNLPRLALEWGADFFQAKIDFERVGDFDYVQWWYETALPFFENEKKSLDGKVRIFTGAGLRCSEIPYCHAHHVITAITADGDVAFCKMKRDERQFALGNIHKQSLRNIMDSERHRRLARELTPMTCETYETFCPYRTTNFNMQDYMNGVEIPTPETLTHINFF